MAWKGKIFGAVFGFFVGRGLYGAIVGFLIGSLIDEALSGRGRVFQAGGPRPISIAEVFFRTTFELMGHVAKADGRVTEAEIDAARRLMQRLNLTPPEVAAAIEFFRTGKSPSYDAELAILRLREACAMRHDLLYTFVELQLQAALDGSGLSPPARAILTRAAETLGIPGLEFARMEAALRARERAGAGGGRAWGAGGAARGPRPLSDAYSELEVDPAAADQEVTKAYRRQMSRHHPDKLVANGLPESMAQVAKEKTQRIQEAYEAIRAARGMR
jgi:DnaJ like chaperone protein